MVCKNCNGEILDSQIYCGNCGVKVEIETLSNGTKEKKDTSIMNKVNIELEGERQLQIKCLKCGSVNVWTGKKGFGFVKAAIGTVLLGPVGAVGGLIGSKKVKFVCQTCGHKWTY